MDFFGDAMKKAERAQRIEAFKATREMYLELRAAGFKMIEAMCLIASFVFQAQKDNEDKE